MLYILILGWYLFLLKVLFKYFNYGNIYYYFVESVICFDFIEFCSDIDSGIEIG